MAVPKRRISRSRQGMRRSHLHVKPLAIQYCKNCDQPVLAHKICANCGHYQGKDILRLGTEN